MPVGKPTGEEVTGVGEVDAVTSPEDSLAEDVGMVGVALGDDVTAVGVLLGLLLGVALGVGVRRGVADGVVATGLS